ncbi:hypothetical protein CYLTODRAFT_427800 [Cylindrobasidium torrendii FP15055 ss-10]|uniref:Uncharacterized protein n=1 Tax=Cylindrobasidium torrendii FP15055 ss-10 TaxID=1314674 RepID=A0A0D7ATP9_9AGAR|nr:hypothetical protein CYLTODRAFT_427800 [Cylindrobasidium torrendii FP15055 ss-10]
MSQKGCIIVDEAHGYRIVAHDENAIIARLMPDGTLDMELVVLREVPSEDELREPLLASGTRVIKEACIYRRDQRPNHTGRMAQIGWTTGARHLQPTLDYGVSFKNPNLSDSERTRQDTELIGVLSLLWALVTVNMPHEIVESVTRQIYDSMRPYPPMGTRQVPPGSGFSFDLDGLLFEFRNATRCPPEGYATFGYEATSHHDDVWVKWAFAATFGREVPADGELQQRGLQHAGGNFVDCDLEIVVQQAAGTVIAFMPEHEHGTTRGYGIHNAIVALTSLGRIHRQWDNLSLASVTRFMPCNDHQDM